jgi:SAM-dependent methyltransferase
MGLQKWNEPSRFLMEHVALFPPGRALDVAAGPGRNAVFLAKEGFVVDAVDNSRVGLSMARELAREAGVGLNLIFSDLERYVIRPGRYDLIVVFYYLNRELFPAMVEGLRPGGYVVFESFTARDNQRTQSKNPHHYLAPNELLALGRGLFVVKYEEVTVLEQNMPRNVARLIARKEKEGKE